MKYNYDWTLKDAKFTKDKGTVFSCFACGGGSTMGYKLAGFDVIGYNEIDPRMAEIYNRNHNPKFRFVEGIQTFKMRTDLPTELYHLDILDGSPPCSSFSICGNREKDWGTEKKFREGQTKQILDTLFFDFIDLAKALQPKIVVAENVKGILLGNAIEYVREIYRCFDIAGYYLIHFLLNGSDMGVPQKRERVFFIGIRKDIAIPFLRPYGLFDVIPQIDMQFKLEPILFKSIQTDTTDRPLTEHYVELWNKRKPGDKDMSAASGRLGRNENAQFSRKYIYPDAVANTICANDVCVLYEHPRLRNHDELCLCSSFPRDYDFGIEKPDYVTGMSVPPVMIAQIASRIYDQWLSKIIK